MIEGGEAMLHFLTKHVDESSSMEGRHSNYVKNGVGRRVSYRKRRENQLYREFIISCEREDIQKKGERRSMGRKKW